MSVKRILIGCGITCLVALTAAVISGFLLVRYYSARSPLPSPASLVDSETLGMITARLEPDDPWVKGLFEGASRGSSLPFQSRENPGDILPMEAIWLTRRGGPEAESYQLTLSVAPKGRLFGMVFDFALWQAGRSEKPGISRASHAGEGITSFEVPGLRGHVFARGNRIVWSSDLATARHGIDRLLIAEGAAAGNAASPSGAGPEPGGAGPRLIDFVPACEGQFACGAFLNEGGSLSRALQALAGEALEMTPDALGPVTSLSFVLDTRTEDHAEGEVRLRMREGTDPQAASALAASLAARISGLKPLGLEFAAAPAGADSSMAVLSLKVSGMKAVSSSLIQRAVSMGEALESMQEEPSWPSEAPPEAPPEPGSR
ncbi:MAG TPA: hypothetical protein VFP98_00980 [Candidatus Polarisedimenticolia bacterium]|nr:hypothetical protein [Candidatus Polarisedimenticolia bacterium]